MSRHSRQFYRNCALGLGERGKHCNVPYIRGHIELQPILTQRAVNYTSKQYSHFPDDNLLIASSEIRWEIFNFLIAGGLAIKLAEEIARMREI